ncbi:response regulator transcription factor [Bifidobacterium stellenboschense]|uniref:Two-component response regulator n=1 Tax=Bifidobacterium stellenboschense TaxID=762211 RepID=A0A087DPW2_9BIFI|nr:response regulator transcription factor [Bifidobacterium stellenboschense]KFI97562.1 two-component response regulator [Bifidobacterium stellenboschense]
MDMTTHATATPETPRPETPRPTAAASPERLLLPAVLLIEDDPNLGAMTAEMLAADYRTDWAQSVGEANRLMAGARYDALIVDRRLPDGDGLDLIRMLRGTGVTTPALILTALAEVDDIVEGLDAGANDYLTKPFHFVELEARLRALLRGFHAQANGVMVGDWLLKPDANVIEDPDGRAVPLTDVETKLLAMLATSPDHVFTREELLAGAFSPGSDLGAVDVYVSYVRGKTTRRIIDTVRGRGYRIGTPEG